MSKIDLRNSPVENADVDCQGVFKIRLKMAGGELTGHMQGTGALSFEGEVSRVSIKKEGPCKVTHEKGA